MSVRKPGVSRSVPPTTTMPASASSRLGTRPVRRAAWSACQVLRNSRRTSQHQGRSWRSGAAPSTTGRSPGRPGSGRRSPRSAPAGTRGPQHHAWQVNASRGLVVPRAPDDLLPAVCDPPHRDPDQRLSHDVAAHLAIAVLALDERDRHLDHPQPGAGRPGGEVDLEAVPGRGDVVEFEAFERGPTERAVPAGDVPDRRPSNVRA